MSYRSTGMHGLGAFRAVSFNITPPEQKPEMTTISVRTLQKLLLKKGVSVGRTGADGIWGPMTKGAYRNACAETSAPSSFCGVADVSGSKRQVKVPKQVYEGIKGLPTDPLPDPAAGTRNGGSATFTYEPTPGSMISPQNGDGDAWPWVLGAGAVLLVGAGAWWYYKKGGGQKAVTANRRRRRRRRS